MSAHVADQAAVRYDCLATKENVMDAPAHRLSTQWALSVAIVEVGFGQCP